MSAVLTFAAFTCASSGTAEPGQVAGRVVRADTGAPLPEVVVTLEALGPNPQCQRGKDRVAKSAADGSYMVPDVPPGCYYVVAYRTGFIGAIYGAPTLRQQGKLVTVVAGEKLGNIDFRLQLAPTVTEIDDKGLANNDPKLRDPELRLGLRIGRGRFSTNGRFFAFFVNGNADINRLWRYDMRSGQPASLGKRGIDLAWDGDALYIQDIDSHSTRASWVEVVTPAGLKEASEVPAAVARTFKRDEPPEGTVDYQEQNDRYFVSGEHPCHACGENVKVRRKGDKRGHLIATGLSGSFLFDPARSVLIYPDLGLSPALVTVDLDSRVPHTFQLPTPALDVLLDELPEPDGYEVAFVAGGSCLPEEPPDSGQNPWILPDNVEYRRQHSFPRHVCFAHIQEPPGHTPPHLRH
jgi:hypothetical protein